MRNNLYKNGLITTIMGCIVIMFSLYLIYDGTDIVNTLPLFGIGLALLGISDKSIGITNGQNKSKRS